MTGRFVAGLRAVAGERHVLTDPELRAPYERDWTGRWRGECLAVVRPADAGQVAGILRACAANGVAVVPQGGNTGLVGGGVPRAGGRQVVLSSARLNALGEVEPASAQVTAGAGVTLAALQDSARSAGLDVGLDLAARGSATIGGLAACDAGGLRALRHGTARRQIVGVEAVLPGGGIVGGTSRPLKDNAGYDLGALLIGAEGTLGVITAVRWSLIPRRDARAVALLALGSVAEAVAAMRSLRPALPSLEVCEMMTETGLRLTLDHLAQAPPVAITAAWMLLECASTADPLDELAAALDAVGLAERAVIAVDAGGRERLLRLREAHTEAIAAAGVAHKLDVGVPLHRLSELMARLDDVVAAAGAGGAESRVIVFGHLGDGNLHINLLGPAFDGDAVDAAVLELVAECEGTISAEHGLGVHKPRFLSLVRSAAELHAMHAIKAALDPARIMNPGAGPA